MDQHLLCLQKFILAIIAHQAHFVAQIGHLLKTGTGALPI
jgi:hypothetical protein